MDDGRERESELGDIGIYTNATPSRMSVVPSFAERWHIRSLCPKEELARTVSHVSTASIWGNRHQNLVRLHTKPHSELACKMFLWGLDSV